MMGQNPPCTPPSACHHSNIPPTKIFDCRVAVVYFHQLLTIFGQLPSHLFSFHMCFCTATSNRETNCVECKPGTGCLVWVLWEPWCHMLGAPLTYLWRERAKLLMEGWRQLILADCCVLMVVLCCCVLARAILGTLLVEKSISSKSKRPTFARSYLK
jgi:hypothetical protein